MTLDLFSRIVVLCVLAATGMPFTVHNFHRLYSAEKITLGTRGSEKRINYELAHYVQKIANPRLRGNMFANGLFCIIGYIHT